MNLITKSTARADALLALSERFEGIRSGIVACESCERLRTYCKGIGEKKRRAYMDHTYWAKPVPGFGDPRAEFSF